jgi:hypothetical protein
LAAVERGVHFGDLGAGLAVDGVHFVDDLADAVFGVLLHPVDLAQQGLDIIGQGGKIVLQGLYRMMGGGVIADHQHRLRGGFGGGDRLWRARGADAKRPRVACQQDRRRAAYGDKIDHWPIPLLTLNCPARPV